MGAVLWWVSGPTLAWTEFDQAARLVRLGLSIGLGALLYGGRCWRSGCGRDTFSVT
ncbi:hypothetical protein [Thiorhodococcus drewsii]|uniref:hypothetical protein n=1 Tax=Thiorhodococcus drewsii TaxID=210408 RepID=UPI0003019CAC|nr:hypothetical protein [Thiorhodococcus drewsii]